MVFLQEAISLARSLPLPLDRRPHTHPGICEPYLSSQQSFADVTKLRILGREGTLDARGSDVTMPVPQAGAGDQRQEAHHRSREREDAALLALGAGGGGGGHAPAMEGEGPQLLGKAGTGPPAPLERISPADTSMSPVSVAAHCGPPELRDGKLVQC